MTGKNRDTTEKPEANQALYSNEYLREHKLGPDYDPDYSAKLEGMLIEEFGGLGELVVVNG